MGREGHHGLSGRVTFWRCEACGCRWKQHADKTLSLNDPAERMCKRCDNAPFPPLVPDEESAWAAFDSPTPARPSPPAHGGDGHAHRWLVEAHWTGLLRARCECGERIELEVAPPVAADKNTEAAGTSGRSEGGVMTTGAGSIHAGPACIGKAGSNPVGSTVEVSPPASPSPLLDELLGLCDAYAQERADDAGGYAAYPTAARAALAARLGEELSRLDLRCKVEADYKVLAIEERDAALAEAAAVRERLDEYKREWESACERERAANHLLQEARAVLGAHRIDAQKDLEALRSQLAAAEERAGRAAASYPHRACTATEHAPWEGKCHGNCVVCNEAWPCATERAQPWHQPAGIGGDGERKA